MTKRIIAVIIIFCMFFTIAVQPAHAIVPVVVAPVIVAVAGLGYLVTTVAKLLLVSDQETKKEEKEKKEKKIPSEEDKSPKKDPIPKKAYDILERIKKNGGRPPGGYIKPSIFRNIPQESGEKKIPNPNKKVEYVRYDIDPTYWDSKRGEERIIIGTDGSVWYTPDHYKSWFRMPDVK